MTRIPKSPEAQRRQTLKRLGHQIEHAQRERAKVDQRLNMLHQLKAGIERMAAKALA